MSQPQQPQQPQPQQKNGSEVIIGRINSSESTILKAFEKAIEKLTLENKDLHAKLDSLASIMNDGFVNVDLKLSSGVKPPSKVKPKSDDAPKKAVKKSEKPELKDVKDPSEEKVQKAEAPHIKFKRLFKTDVEFRKAICDKNKAYLPIVAKFDDAVKNAPQGKKPDTKAVEKEFWDIAKLNKGELDDASSGDSESLAQEEIEQ